MKTIADESWGYRGWRVVAVAFVCHFVGVGFFFYSYGVFFKPVAAELGGSRFEVSLGLSGSQLLAALVAPLIGRAVEHGVRRVIVAGAIANAIGFALLTQVHSLWMFYFVLATLVGIGSLAMGGLSPLSMVAGWFSVRRGTALGIATVGVSMSGLVMPTVGTWLIERHGWRGGFGVYAAAVIVLVVPLALWVAADPPKHEGGAAPAPMSTRRLLTDRAFWSLTVGFGLTSMSLGAVLTHMVPFLTDMGLDSFMAASLLSLSAGAAIGGKFLFGAVADRVAARPALWLSLAIQLAGLGMFMTLPSRWGLAAAALVFGIGMGGIVPLQSLLVAEAFGTTSYARAAGLMRPFMLPLSASGVPLAGWVFDRYGSYRPAHAAFVAAYLAGAAVIAWWAQPARRS